jgi:fumarate reductase subunit C
VHIVVMVYAVRGGLSAAEILGRTRGSAGWAAFYALFVLAVAVHAPIGLRAVAVEWLGWRGRTLGIFLHLFGLLLLVLGLRAVWAVFA